MRSFRIFLFFLMVAAFAVYPFLHDLTSQHQRRVAEAIMIAGQSNPVAGQDIEPDGSLTLKAPSECEVGELVRLDVSESTVDGITWQILPATDDFEVIEDGRRAFFSARSGGTFLVMIAGAKDGKAHLIHHTLVVKGEELPPGPQSLSSKVVSWVKSVPDHPKKKDLANGLAGVFRKMATAEDVKVEQILEATALANSAVLGADLEKWVPFLEALGKELDTYVAAGTLTTREQYKEVWTSIADGLEKAVK